MARHDTSSLFLSHLRRIAQLYALSTALLRQCSFFAGSLGNDNKYKPRKWCNKRFQLRGNARAVLFLISTPFDCRRRPAGGAHLRACPSLHPLEQPSSLISNAVPSCPRFWLEGLPFDPGVFSPARRFFQGRPPSTHPCLCPAAATFFADVGRATSSPSLDLRVAAGFVLPPAHATARMLPQGPFLPLFGVSRTLQNGMHASCLFIRLSIPNCPCSGSTKTGAGARTDSNTMPSPSCRPRAQAALSTFVSRGNAVRTPAGILHSFLAGALRIPLAAAGAGRTADSPSPPPSCAVLRWLGCRHPSLSCTITGPVLLAVFRSSLGISVLEASIGEIRWMMLQAGA
ncbi:hypothetical protein B0H13DRAFT_2365884 [Mycena leptocephala]|nr:hypothetical protein B0H13DRAFT_2365884 [Mycena leptocephala]